MIDPLRVAPNLLEERGLTSVQVWHNRVGNQAKRFIVGTLGSYFIDGCSQQPEQGYISKTRSLLVDGRSLVSTSFIFILTTLPRGYVMYKDDVDEPPKLRQPRCAVNEGVNKGTISRAAGGRTACAGWAVHSVHLPEESPQARLLHTFWTWVLLDGRGIS
jgi:hypothetical protein